MISKTSPEDGYKLLDSGDGEKLERYGKFLISRPDPQALWKKNLIEAEWKKTNAFFKRATPTSPSPSSGRRGEPEWSTRGEIADRWQIEFGELKFWIKLSAFKTPIRSNFML